MCSRLNRIYSKGTIKGNRRCLRSKADLCFFLSKEKQKPWFSKLLVVGRPNIGDKATFNRYLDTIWDSRVFTNNGPLVQKFEAELRKFLDVKHVVVFVNGTVALETLFTSLPARGDILVPSFTFVATVHAILRAGHTPVFCDIDPVTLCVNASTVEKRVTEKTVAIVGVHLYGAVCDVDRLETLAKQRDIPLFFDAAHAFGCSFKGTKVGSFGKAEVMSFHATKFFHSIEGGAVTTNDPQLASTVARIRSYGMTGQLDEDRTPIHASWGTNGKMSEVCAAMGLTNLVHLDRNLQVNKRNMRLYAEALSGIPGVDLYDLTHASFQSNCQYIVIRVNSAKFGMTRRELAQILAAENVASRPYFFPAVHQLAPYATLYPSSCLDLQITEKVSTEVLCLPSGETVDGQIIADIANLIRFCQTTAKEAS